jgi:hypothetical protein
MKPRKLSLTAAALSMALLILDSRNTMGFAARGIDLCLKTVIPSLFPFFVLSIYMTGNMSAPGSTLPVLLSGFLGGYPTGAQAAAQSHRTGRLTKNEANRLLLFCSQAGPAFLFGMVSAQFPNSNYAWVLWGIQLLSALTVSWLIPNCSRFFESSHMSIRKRQDHMLSALRSMAMVCGWVITFSVVLDFLRRWLLRRCPFWVQTLLCGVTELTNGCLMLQEVSSIPDRFLLAAIILNFGGLCVLMQTASLIQGLKLRNYIMGKIIQTLFAAAYAGIVLGYWWLLIPIFSVFFLKILKDKQNRCGFPQLIGV